MKIIGTRGSSEPTKNDNQQCARDVRRPARDARSWGSRNMRKTIFAAVVMLCACSPTESVMSRVEIPQTALAVVVVQDGKGLYRYRVFRNDIPVTKARIFGGSGSRDPGTTGSERMRNTRRTLGWLAALVAPFGVITAHLFCLAGIRVRRIRRLPVMSNDTLVEARTADRRR